MQERLEREAKFAENTDKTGKPIGDFRAAIVWSLML
jgi:hypothetical protein